MSNGTTLNRLFKVDRSLYRMYDSGFETPRESLNTVYGAHVFQLVYYFQLNLAQTLSGPLLVTPLG